jgi:K(+)-stimulated pyrophosphate-energized sodium pump
VAMNPVIKFTTLFGLLAVELAEGIPDLRLWLAVPFGAVMLIFVWRSFYTMRIQSTVTRDEKAEAAKAEA